MSVASRGMVFIVEREQSTSMSRAQDGSCERGGIGGVVSVSRALQGR